MFEAAEEAGKGKREGAVDFILGGARSPSIDDTWRDEETKSEDETRRDEESSFSFLSSFFDF